MLNENICPSSIPGIKRLANQIKKAKGVSHSQALKLAAKAALFENFEHARHILVDAAGSNSQTHQLFLTFYWLDRQPYAVGRETLEISLSKPLLELCSKSEMRLVRGLGDMRLAAPDHLVTDILGQSRDYARGQLCKAVRALRFMEATGLRPCDYQQARLAKAGLDEDLPKKDHDSDWYDPSTGQFILVDEPYTDPVVSPERADWALRNHWHLRASKWPGTYYPYSCSFFVATNATTGYEFDALMSKIDAISMPTVAENWSGDSVANHETFTSPLAITAQDRRRAKARGTVWREPSKSTIPYSGFGGNTRRRPKGSMPIAEHQNAGRMIKAVLRSRHKPWAVNKRMDSLRSTLEDWLNLEIRPDQLQRSDFFDVYYNDVSHDDPHVVAASSTNGVIEILTTLKCKLQQFYPNCAPLRSLVQKIDTSLRLIYRAETRQQ